MPTPSLRQYVLKSLTTELRVIQTTKRAQELPELTDYEKAELSLFVNANGDYLISSHNNQYVVNWDKIFSCAGAAAFVPVLYYLFKKNPEEMLKAFKSKKVIVNVLKQLGPRYVGYFALISSAYSFYTCIH